ncbi:beta-lactoglobulin [Apodemus sylvaticus]|uniref:beta-lactoglobulin n=1 Tax=Apodemus sylvaticus TaxID=10129 RepID=UPI0022441496|nr:beta-lactoglobulin [Apodemus sylvaticus]
MALVANLVDFVAFLGVENLGDKNIRNQRGQSLGNVPEKQTVQRKVPFWHELDGTLLGPTALGPRCRDADEGLLVAFNTGLAQKNLEEAPVNWTLVHMKRAVSRSATTLVRVWLLVLAFNLDLAQKNLEEVPVQPDFDAHKVEGRWFTIQLATNLRDLVLPTDLLRLSLHSIWTRDSGDVDFVLFEKGEGLCTGLNVTVHPTGLHGQYQRTFDGGRLHVHFVSTDYDNLILYVRIQDDEVVNLWALLARRMLEDPVWLGKYLGFVEKSHLHKSLVFNIAVQGAVTMQAAPLPGFLR